MKGRKRHLLVDSLGWLRQVQVTGAGVQDQYQAFALIEAEHQVNPRLAKVWGDEGYQNNELARKVQEQVGIELELIPKPQGEGFQVARRRWVVERTFAWLGRYRRLSKDYEYCPQTSEAWIYLGMIGHMLRHLTSGSG